VQRRNLLQNKCLRRGVRPRSARAGRLRLRPGGSILLDYARCTSRPCAESPATFTKKSYVDVHMNTRGLFASDRGIVLAADVSDLAELRRLVRAAAAVPQVVGAKIGFSLALRYGLAPVVKVIREESALTLIYDHQKAATDIPEMGKPFADLCRDAGVDGVIFFPQAGPKTLEAFVSAAVDCGLEPIVGLVMTHPAYLQSEGGFISNDAPESICRLAVNMKVSHYVLPGTKTALVSQFAAGPLKAVQPASVLMPGIGTQGGSIAAAFAAARPHRRFAIVGSAVYRAAEPQKVLESLAAEVRA